MSNAESHSAELVQPRLSTLSLAALACALGALAGCGLTVFTFVTGGRFVWWVVVAMPVLGLLALSLGGTAHAAIRRSQGRLWGREPATAAVLMGIGALVIGGAFVGTGIARYLSLRNAVAPALSRMLSGIADDPALARETLSEAAAKDVTDDRLRALRARLIERTGDNPAAGVELSIFRLASDEMKRAAARGAFAAGSTTPAADPPLPIEIIGASGRVFAWVLLDSNALQTKKELKIDDLLVMLSTGDGITLRPGGRARALADYLAVTVEELPMFMPPDDAPGQ